VVGDVDHHEVFKLAEQHFGSIETHELPERRITPEPEQHGLRHVELNAPAELPTLVLAWKAPTIDTPTDARDAYALQMLAAVLDGYDGARLPRRLVREQRIAVSADAS